MAARQEQPDPPERGTITRVVSARRPAHGAAARRIGVALAGGGPLGAIYEIGALNALADCLRGIDFTELDIYVGVSSGAFLAAGLANGIRPSALSQMFIESDTAEERFDPSVLLRPAIGEYLRRARSLPPLVAQSIWRYLSDGHRMSLLGSVQRLGRALPTGLFDGAAIDRYLAEIFSARGRTNDFRELARTLCIVATDLDSGASVEFGAPDWDHVPISMAVQASAALPVLFPPVEIGGRYYVDGALKKTLHASVALRHGARLVICVNPLVPFDPESPEENPEGVSRLVDGGLPVVLSQAFRSLIHSRMQVGIERYAREYPDADVVLLEPNRHDAEMFFNNVFSYSSRRRLAEHAYQKTRQELFARRHQLAPVLARHGITFDVHALRDPSRELVRGLRKPRPPRGGMAIARELVHTLDDLERYIRHEEAVLVPEAAEPSIA
jgi:predicted acylesterase/phospholipase RssA